MERKKIKGFTIVEVSLVLGIAGLILLMVFIALPTLQRQARDAQRRDDVLMFINKLKNYQASNNRGALPDGTRTRVSGNVFDINYASGTWGNFYRKFFTDSFTDPSSGNLYSWTITKCDTGTGAGNLSTGDGCNFKKNNEAINDYLDGLNDIDGIMYIMVSASCDGSKAVYSANARKVAVLYKLEAGGVFCANT